MSGKTFTVLSAVLMMSAASAIANEPPTAWQLAKCDFYEDTWRDMLAHFGPDAMSVEFIDQNERFIAGHCLERVAVCPNSETELAVANALPLGAMNGKAARTFLPFAC